MGLLHFANFLNTYIIINIIEKTTSLNSNLLIMYTFINVYEYLKCQVAYDIMYLDKRN